MASKLSASITVTDGKHDSTVVLKSHMFQSARTFVLAVISLLICTPVIAQSEAEPNATSFDDWKLTFRQELSKEGYSDHVLDRVFGSLALIPRVVKKDRNQAEFKETYADYLNKRVSPWRVKKGIEYLENHGEQVRHATETYGVPPRFIVSVLGIETNYGNIKLSYPLFNVLATLAFDSRRGKYFRKEFKAAVKMIDKGYAEYDQLKSSWAGALGHPQFMPSTYLQFAVDADKNGTRDIWNKGPDLYASVANYLAHYGWHDDEAWARKVVVPQKQQNALVADKENKQAIDKGCQRYQKHLYGWKSLEQWNELGVRRMNGAELPNRSMSAALIMTHEDYSHGYLVYRNFCTLMRYNPSFKYALSVGMLSDHLK